MAKAIRSYTDGLALSKPACYQQNMAFNSTSATQAARRSHAEDTRKHYPPMRLQALDLQSALHRAGKSLDEDMEQGEDRTERARIACALASVAKGWQSMTDQLRILAGKPLPGSRRPPPDQPKKPKRSIPRPEPIPEPETVKESDSQV